MLQTNNANPIEQVKAQIALSLKKLGEQAIARCLFPYLQSEPQAPKHIFMDETEQDR